MSIFTNTEIRPDYQEHQIERIKTYLRSTTVVSIIESVEEGDIEIAQILHGFVAMDETGIYEHEDVVISSPIQYTKDCSTRFFTKSGSYYVSVEEVYYVTLTLPEWLTMCITLMNPQDITCYRYLQ
jgi:hypothetical protein